MKTYRIYLLRHGLTDGNREGRYVGKTDLPLSGEGVMQLRDLRKSCQYPDAARFYSSPMIRCTQSLAVLYPSVKPALIPGLAECDFGAYEGKTMEQLRGDPGFESWVACGGQTAPPDGESTIDFQKRCCGAFETIVGELLRSGEQSAVIMAHGGTIMFILATYGYPRRPFYSWICGNGMGYELLITPSLWMSGKALEIVGKIPEGAPEGGLAGLGDMKDEMTREMKKGRKDGE